MKKILVRLLILLAVFAALFVLFRFTGLGEILNFQRIADNRDQLLSWVEENYAAAALVFVGVYIAAVAFSIPGATVLSISGGFFFGPLMGTVFINLGASTGAFLVFLLARWLLGDSVQKKYSERLEQFNKEMQENGPNYLLTLRLVPVFPFFLINLLAGVAAIKPITFLWTTALGIIPGSFVYAYLGYAGASLEPGSADFPFEALIALVLLGLVSLIPVVIKKVRRQKHENNA